MDGLHSVFGWLRVSFLAGFHWLHYVHAEESNKTILLYREAIMKKKTGALVSEESALTAEGSTAVSAAHHCFGRCFVLSTSPSLDMT